jgi:hypothetical protein
MEPTQSSETSAFNTQTPGKYPEDYFSLIDIAFTGQQWLYELPSI